MATQRLELTSGQAGALSALAVLAANYASVNIFAYPFAYCWLSPVVIPIYVPVAGLLNVFCILVFGWKLLVRDYRAAAVAGVVLVVVFGLPQWADILFRMEASCG